MMSTSRLLRGASVSVGLIGILSCSSEPAISDKGGPSSGSGSGSSAGAGAGAGAGGGKNGSAVPVVMPGMPPVFSTSGVMPGVRTDGGNAPPSIGEGPNCGFQTYKLERLPPEILLVLDRSSSMNRKVVNGAAGATLWSDTVSALDETLAQTQDAVQWGMTLYPVPGGCNVGPDVEVGVMTKNHAAIIGKARMMDYNTSGDGGTPTSKTMKKAVDYLNMRQGVSKNPKFVVLATDGQPNCLGDKSNANDDDGAVASVAAAERAGYKTFVVGIGIEVKEKMVLNRMADAGGAPRKDPNDPMTHYYPVANKADLVKTIGEITVVAANCVFPLDKQPPALDSVAVNISGTRVKQDKDNGWAFGPGNKSIVLQGETCEKVKSGGADKVEIIFGCAGIKIP